jgi:hypothetical protein
MRRSRSVSLSILPAPPDPKVLSPRLVDAAGDTSAATGRDTCLKVIGLKCLDAQCGMPEHRLTNSESDV